MVTPDFEKQVTESCLHVYTHVWCTLPISADFQNVADKLQDIIKQLSVDENRIAMSLFIDGCEKIRKNHPRPPEAELTYDELFTLICSAARTYKQTRQQTSDPETLECERIGWRRLIEAEAGIHTDAAIKDFEERCDFYDKIYSEEEARH